MRNYRISIRDTGTQELIDELTFSGPDDGFHVKVAMEVPDLPERSPLHGDALNMDDLRVGLNINRCNIHYGRVSYPNTAIVNGEPFRRGTKYHDGRLAEAWMVPVVTTNYAGKLVHEDWFLADMGVVPFENSDGTRRVWNVQNYTLAVS